jgi:hypothetical protein
MESLSNILLPAVKKGGNAEVIKATDLNRFDEIDYDERSMLISDRLKLHIEMYMPEYDFIPVVYLDTEKDEQAIFWRFRPPLYTDYQATFRSNGIVLHISFSDTHAPIIFMAQSHKGICSIVVRMAVAESTLRRSILGVKFTKVSE